LGGGSGTLDVPGATPSPEGRYGRPIMDEVFRRRYMPQMTEQAVAPPPPAAEGDPSATTDTDSPPSTNHVSLIKLSCRGVDINSINPGANGQIAYLLDGELKKSAMFKNVKLDAQIADDATTGTFTFGISLTLAKPLKLQAAAN